MSNKPAQLSRRSVLKSAALLSAGLSAASVRGFSLPQPAASNGSALKQAAQHSGKILGCYSGMHELLMDPAASSMLASIFSMIAVGNDLKFSTRLRPTPETFDFSFGDADVAWAERHGLLFRGHCLVWWNALPNWFNSYVNAGNARQVMTDHITKTVSHYRGRIYSWDVANEVIYHDNRPDGLRKRPWLDWLGPEYLDLAFHTAHEADPKARLVLNECFIEHATPAEQLRREQLLGVAARLKKSGVPITTIGVQGHLRGAVPLDRPGMTDFCRRVQDLGLDIMITEFDVDDVDVPGPMIDQTVAAKYTEFLEIMGPFVKVITFEQLRNDPGLPKRPDGLPHRPNLFDANYQQTLAYQAVVQALAHLPAAKSEVRI